MSAADTLEKIADLLPEGRRERFLLMSARFKNVPEDDEYLQMLEAIGLMTLLWREVPEQIEQLLDKASPVGANHQQLRALIAESVTQSIPTYDDLKRSTERLENLELSLKRLLGAINQSPQPKPRIGIAGISLFATGFILNELIAFMLYRLS